jgi:PAT family beta-lactamase induction signal transducer AmpG
MLTCIFIGFSSGLPLYFIMQFVPAWLRRFDVDLKTIGLIGLVQLPYAWKFIWAPLCDRYTLPLGRRRGWMLFTQVLLLISMASLGFLRPENSLNLILVGSVIVAFFSATQDIVLDAFRRDILPDHELGLGTTFHMNAYRIAGFIPMFFGLRLVDLFVGEMDFSKDQAWQSAFFFIALFMLPGILCTIFVSEPKLKSQIKGSLKDTVIEPFKEFFGRSGTGTALLILTFMLLYKFGDTLATSLITPFYIDMGFTNTEIADVSKVVGVSSMIFGGFLGGVIMLKIGINKSLWLFGVVQMVSILGFAVLAEVGHHMGVFAAAVAFEYIGVGLGSAAFGAFIAAQSNQKFSATQMALFSSLFALPRATTGLISGFLVEGYTSTTGQVIFAPIGWTNFFIVCFFTAIPGMILLKWVAPWGAKQVTV